MSARKDVLDNEHYLKAASKSVWMDEQDERHFGIRPARPSRTAERLGIERYLRTYCLITGDDYEAWHDKITRMYSNMHYYDVDVNVRHVREDIVDNFLYREYLEQLDDDDAIRSYSCYATYIAAKAAIALITDHQVSVGTSIPIKREDALRFKARDDYDETDPTWFISNALADVPGMWEAVQALQHMYGEVVRVECALQDKDIVGLLPDNPENTDSELGVADFPEPLRLEQAVQAFLADEGTANEIAARYGFGQKRFRAYLKENGYMRPHGGDRKARFHGGNRSTGKRNK